MVGVPPSCAPRARLSFEARLHQPSQFQAAFKGRRVARGAWFMLHASSPAASDPTPARLGLVIGKRFAALATTRNALKRVIRESFRMHRCKLPAGDYVVRLHAKVPPASLTSLKRAARQEIDAHFARAARR